MKIHLLDESTINKIAAGEVVERPASVVKEIVENSLDAGATQITVDVVEGGAAIIRVSDNGEGMSLEEANLALQRHATSKLQSAEDLFSINTMGFRGEALPSIASVSKLTLATRAASVENGISLKINGGKHFAQESVGIPKGTTITIEDLFFNVPARKKFLKSEKTELSQIIQVMEKLILGNTNIQFKFSHNGKLLIQSTGSGKFIEAIVSIYGKDIASHLLPISLNTSDSIQMSGFTSLPTYLTNDRKAQVIFVNQRPIVDPIIGKAIREGYRNTIPSEKHPYTFLFIKIDPGLVDVNVHPAKREVRFAKSQDVFSAVRSAIDNALIGKAISTEEVNNNQSSYTPFQSQANRSASYSENPNKFIKPEWNSSMFPKWAELIDNESKSGQQRTNTETPEDINQLLPSSSIINADAINRVSTDSPIFQVANTYLVTVIDRELSLIDQHTAHERILFNKFSQQAADSKIASQQLLVPFSIELPAKEATLFTEHLESLSSLGFDIEDFGKSSFLIRAVPIEIAERNPQGILLETFSELVETGQARVNRDEVVKMMACKAAVKAGDRLTSEEMKALVLELQRTPNVHTCPHGRPVVVKITEKELAKMFHR